MTSKLTRSQHRLARSGLRWTGRTIMLVILAAVVGAVTVLMVLPRATHGAALTVLTGSMSPEIPVGSVVLVRPTDAANLRVGDVATYQAESGKEEFITHRIVDIDPSTEPTSFTFKGDANRGPDLDPVPAGAIRGEVWFHVPYLGAIRDSLHGKAGLSLLAMVLLGGYAIVQGVGAVREIRRGRTDTGPGSAPEPSRLLCDGPLVVATFPSANLPAAPCLLARQWGGLVLAKAEESCTVLLAPQPGTTAATVELLRGFAPTQVEVVERPIILDPERPDAQPPVDIDREGVHAVA